MRLIQNECKTKPLIGKYKIFILDEAHMLTVQAWNSMLKILEEPPEYVIFIFLYYRSTKNNSYNTF